MHGDTEPGRAEIGCGCVIWAVLAALAVGVLVAVYVTVRAFGG
ncbi:hypothetical protein [Microbispora sp. NPDC049633]